MRLIGDIRSELFHYEVRVTYDTPEVAESRRIVREAQQTDDGPTWQISEWQPHRTKPDESSSPERISKVRSKKASTSNRAFYLIIGALARRRHRGADLSVDSSERRRRGEPDRHHASRGSVGGIRDRQRERADRGRSSSATSSVRSAAGSRRSPSLTSARGSSTPERFVWRYIDFPLADARQHVERIARGGVRRRAGEVLGDARRDLREQDRWDGAGDEQAGQGAQADRWPDPRDRRPISSTRAWTPRRRRRRSRRTSRSRRRRHITGRRRSSFGRQADRRAF